MSAKDGLIILERGLALKCQDKGEAASDHEAADGFLDSIKKIIGEKGYQPEQVYNVD